MRRAVCLISLVTFIAQQMICCCDGAGVHHTENASGNTSVQAGVADSLEVAASKKSCCGHGTRTQCQSAPSKQVASQQKEDGQDVGSQKPDEPSEEPHQHHLCVGTHLFYNSPDVTRTLDLLTRCLFIDVGDLALLLDDQCEPSFSSRIPVWVTHPPRSVLSVYLV